MVLAFCLLSVIGLVLDSIGLAWPHFVVATNGERTIQRGIFCQSEYAKSALGTTYYSWSELRAYDGFDVPAWITALQIFYISAFICSVAGASICLAHFHVERKILLWKAGAAVHAVHASLMTIAVICVLAGVGKTQREVLEPSVVDTGLVDLGDLEVSKPPEYSNFLGACFYFALFSIGTGVAAAVLSYKKRKPPPSPEATLEFAPAF